MKPNLTKDQRKRLTLLARLLERVSPKKFSMRQWCFRISQRNDNFIENESMTHTPKECGFAGCAIGWGMSSRAIRGNVSTPEALISSLGFKWTGSREKNEDGDRLFGFWRKAGPRTVARDIRTYLKTGALPKE